MQTSSDFVEYMDEANERASLLLDLRDATREALDIPAPQPCFVATVAAARDSAAVRLSRSLGRLRGFIKSARDVDDWANAAGAMIGDPRARNVAAVLLIQVLDDEEEKFLVAQRVLFEDGEPSEGSAQG